MSDSVAAPNAPAAAPAEGNQPQLENASNQTAPAPESNASSKPKRKFIDVDGEQWDAEELKRERQKWRGADGRFREAAQAKKEVEEFYKKLAEDPDAVLRDPKLPLNRRQLAEKWLLEAIEEETMDPREREFRQKESELKQYKDREEKAKAEAESKAKEALKSERREAISKTFNEALALSPLSKDPEVAAETLRHMAMYMRIAKQQGLSPDAKELAQVVESRNLKSMRGVASTLEGEALIQFLGPEIARKIRMHDLAQLKASREKPDTARPEEWNKPADTNAPRKFIDPRQALIKK